VIATNENDEFPKYISSGTYRKIEPSRNCISSAMNVGHPSNLARLVALYGGVMDETGVIHKQADLGQMRKELWAVSVTDQETRETIASTYRDYATVMEPHGAVAWSGLMKYRKSDPELDLQELCISLETAHPAKFPEEIEKILSVEPELPPGLQGIDNLPEHVEELENSYHAFTEYLEWYNV